MGSEAGEPELISTPKLPLFTLPPMQSPEHPGMLTPPYQTPVSVPFRWEQEPGKPRPCTTLISLSNPVDLTPKCLELPPRLLLDKLPSPTTVLEGPYPGRTRVQSASFRLSGECYGAFSPERGQLGTMVLGNRKVKVAGWFGSWRRRVFFKGNKEVNGGSYVFPSSVDRASDDDGFIEESSRGNGKKKMNRARRARRAGSFSSLSYPRSQFWSTIYEGLKHAVPWKSKKLNKGF
ncbi:hypothetical protein UlMin_021732 [Ulmus minor]